MDLLQGDLPVRQDSHVGETASSDVGLDVVDPLTIPLKPSTYPGGALLPPFSAPRRARLQWLAYDS
jgi:hypothetical protein